MLSFAVLTSFICLHTATAQIPVINDGNDDTPISHVQYIASFQLVLTEEQFFCAGVFISRKAVLTLATCFYKNDVLLNPEEVRVVGGSSFRLDSNRNTYSGVLKEIVIHENFGRSSLESNLAIGFLLDEIPDNNIKTINLEDIATSSPDEATKCQIYGWSLTTRFQSSPHLLSGEVIIETRDKCDITNNKITSTTLCAGPYFINGCETDDGSPLVCNKKICGLIDYRPTSYCSYTITDRLGTYVDLSEFHDWIAERAASKRVVTSASIIFLSGVIMKLLC